YTNGQRATWQLPVDLLFIRNSTMSSIKLDERGVIAPCGACGQKNRTPFERLGDAGKCGNCKEPLPAPSIPLDAHSVQAFEALIRSSPIPVLVDFWAEWCGPCRMVTPEVAKVTASNAGRLVTAKVNTEELPVLARRFDVSSIPLLVLFHGGKEVSRIAGARPAAAI